MTRPFRTELLSPATAADDGRMSALAGLVNDIYAVSEEGLWADGVTRTSVAEIADFARAGEIAVAAEGERVLGCVRVHLIEAGLSEFGMLATVPSHRGMGIGRDLVRFAEQRARDIGCGTMQLKLLVPQEGKHPSKEFLAEWYGRMGYTVSERHPIETVYPSLFPLLATPCDFVICRKRIRP
jgi:GNAT superfamily N-acetyltransferase